MTTTEMSTKAESGAVAAVNRHGITWSQARQAWLMTAWWAQVRGTRGPGADFERWFRSLKPITLYGLAEREVEAMLHREPLGYSGLDLFGAWVEAALADGREDEVAAFGFLEIRPPWNAYDLSRHVFYRAQTVNTFIETARRRYACPSGRDG